MAEPVLDSFQVNTLLDQQGSTGVTQIVQPDVFINSGALHNLWSLRRPPQRVHIVPGGPAENKVIFQTVKYVVFVIGAKFQAFLCLPGAKGFQQCKQGRGEFQ